MDGVAHFLDRIADLKHPVRLLLGIGGHRIGHVADAMRGFLGLVGGYMHVAQDALEAGDEAVDGPGHAADFVIVGGWQATAQIALMQMGHHLGNILHPPFQAATEYHLEHRHHQPGQNQRQQHHPQDPGHVRPDPLSGLNFLHLVDGNHAVQVGHHRFEMRLVQRIRNHQGVCRAFRSDLDRALETARILLPDIQHGFYLFALRLADDHLTQLPDMRIRLGQLFPGIWQDRVKPGYSQGAGLDFDQALVQDLPGLIIIELMLQATQAQGNENDDCQQAGNGNRSHQDELFLECHEGSDSTVVRIGRLERRICSPAVEAGIMLTLCYRNVTMEALSITPARSRRRQPAPRSPRLPARRSDSGDRAPCAKRQPAA